ncbi:MAG: hypothetical protein OEM60_02575 [Gammaproteobacteria bacterium]|nr:hypothetical protein [Gammaproteobacteria bacterium]MDH3432723.1 hypothetical protein [Gammaproteobacteria bacterium]
MLPLIRTLFDIVLLRKGPADIPRSWILFVLVLMLWLFSALVALALIEQFDESDFFLGFFSGVIGIVCYAALVVFAGKPERLLQTISAIIGCGALISFAFIAEYVLFLPFLGEVTTGLIANLILLWSVPVEGHIIARAIDRHWYIGILLAIVVFALQFVIYSVVTTTP